MSAPTPSNGPEAVWNRDQTDPDRLARACLLHLVEASLRIIDKTNSARKMTKRTFAISAAVPAIAPNPRIPAMMAMNRKTKVYASMVKMDLRFPTPQQSRKTHARDNDSAYQQPKGLVGGRSGE